jgi:hypothetical protein
MIKRYTTCEPNSLFAGRLKDWLGGTLESGDVPLPCLENGSKFHRTRFPPSNIDEKFDIILFCHSLYGINPNHAGLRASLGMLTQAGVIVVFHRDHTLCLDGLLCHQRAAFPAATIKVPDEDTVLDSFASFIY